MNFTSLPSPRRRGLLRRLLPTIDRFVVFSNLERELYAQEFDIPLDRLDFMHWGVQPPPLPATDPGIVDGEYLCAVGGEGRDYRVLVEAMRRLPHIRAEIVARPQNLAGVAVPDNVRVRTDIPRLHANHIIQRSRFMVLPLAHREVPCGHVTLVAAMYLGKALLITGSRGIEDYVEDGHNGIHVPPGDAAILAEQIDALWADPQRASQMGECGRQFAMTHCSEQSSIEQYISYLKQFGLFSDP